MSLEKWGLGKHHKNHKHRVSIFGVVVPISGLKHSKPTRLYVGDGVEEFSGFVAAHWGSVGGVKGRNDGKIYLWGKPRGGKVLETD
jgi:hypothetical protein